MRDQNGHQWIEASRHRTSEGSITYRHCHCGLWQVAREPMAAGHIVVIETGRQGGSEGVRRRDRHEGSATG